MAIHKNDDGTCVVSSKGTWLPGIFEDERTARLAFRLSDEVLLQLQEEANARAGGTGGLLTWGDLARASEQARARPTP